jgi:type II secretory pathway component PulK
MANNNSRRRGTILILVLLIIVALAGMVLSLGRWARVEAMTSANHAAGARASAAERAAEQYVVALLAQQRQTVMTADESNFNAIPVGENAGVFWIIRPDYGDSSMPSYGLVDEGSKINLNLRLSNVSDSSARVAMLQALPGFPEDLAYAVNDWIDGDNDVSGNGKGAEEQYYVALPNPYHCKNGNFEAVEELVLVKGAYPELLYGDGVAGQQFTGSRSGGLNIDGLSENDVLARGLFNYITVYSKEPTVQGQGARRGRININTATREVLQCLPGLTEANVSAIISKRSGNGFGQPGVQLLADALGAAKATQLANYVVGESYQFSADIVAASGDGRAFRRVRIVVDASDANYAPKVVYRHDLTDRGWPMDPGILDAMRAGTWTSNQPVMSGISSGISR